MHKLAFVIPTKDRPNDMRVMLTSLSRQTLLPNQIIVVDGSNPDIQSVINEFPQLHIDYVRVYPPSLAKQRNEGMKKIKPEITLAGYLDDDVELQPNAVASMMNYWEKSAPDLGGTCFNIVNTDPARWTKVKSVFGIDGSIPGKVFPSGCVSILGYQSEDIETDWLCGGATIWRREIIENYPYDEWFKGTGFLEDVDYSFNVREKYRLALVASAKLSHYSPPIRSDRHFLLGKWQIVNRMYFVRKYRMRGLSISKAWIANFGMLYLRLIQALLKRDRNSWNQFRGHAAGIWSEIRGKNEQIGGFLK